MKKLKSALKNVWDFMTLFMAVLLLPVWFLVGAVMQSLGKESIQFLGWDLSVKG